MTNEIQVHWQKIKFKNLGKQGVSELMYNYKNGRFEQKTGAGINNWDNSNWLIKEIKQNKIIENEKFETQTDIYKEVSDVPF